MLTLAHLSDPHLAPLPEPRWSELIGKRVTGYVNWQRKRRFIHDPAVLSAIAADIRAQAPDHIAVTGDIANIALPAEFPRGRDWLESLGSAQDVTFVPGNHDIYVREAGALAARQWGAYMSDDDGEGGFPFVRRRGNVALIGLSTGVPTAPFLATGWLGTKQLAEFAAILNKLKDEDFFRVILIHHPPVSDAARHKRLMDASILKRVIAAQRDASVRQLLVELAEAEAGHESLAHKLSQEILTTGARAKEEETARRMFVLQYVQPGLAGLMDGSVSTLAPLFAAAFATHSTWETFLVGMAASVGAGISMGFAEALSDDGSLTGRGAPLLRGTVCGVMTAIGGRRPHSALSHPGFLCRDRRRNPCRGGRTGGNLLDPHPLHGHAVPAGGIPGGCRWCARVHCGHLDREFMIPHQGTDADPRASFRPASRASAGAALERADRQAGDRIH